MSHSNALDFSFEQRPDFTWLNVSLRAGQKILAEPSAMATMDPTVTMKAGLRGGLGKTFGRMLGGESLIMNTFAAPTAGGAVRFAPGTPGDMAHKSLDGGKFYLQRGAFVAHSEGVELSGRWQGARGFFSGQGLVLLEATGQGDLFFNAYGAILPIDVTDELIVDTGYVVAFEDTLAYQVSVMPGLRPGAKVKSFLFGGEGLVCRFRGQGKVWVQTRDAGAFLRWTYPFRPVRSKNVSLGDS
ncbi:MAG: TIGR00266 family protein [Deltaproteobacteria bacterium]|nr:TIGR00266 family protein [Deltaproteobacteria bacterium]